jgi:hypothetical protein
VPALDAWFPHDEQGDMGNAGFRRLCIQYYLNGNWQGSEVQHFCAVGCCPSEDFTRAAIMKWVPDCLLPYAPVRVAQHRWVGLLFIIII